MPTPQMLCPCVACLCARRVSDNQIPTPPLFMRSAVHSRERAASIEQEQAIAHNMPLRMPATALLNVTAIRFMTQRSERLAHFLALLASYQYVYNVTSFSFIQPHKISRAIAPCKLLGKTIDADNVRHSVISLLSQAASERLAG